MERIIYHIDVNSAFLSWEAVYRIQQLGDTADLREIPSAVGGDMAARRGIILAKSTPAKAFGIKTAMTVIEAKRKCPDLYIVLPNHELYEKYSEAFMKILEEYTPKVEKYSIDEAFMDMTETISLFGEPVAVANQIRERIYETLGFTVNIGVSANKVLAKMAGEFRKPNLVHTLFPDEISRKLWPLPVSELFLVGKATARKLLGMGINTIGELAKTDVKVLRAILKKQGEVIWRFANGIDSSAVEEMTSSQKCFGNSTTIAYDVKDADTAKLILLSLADTVAARLRHDELCAQVVAIGIKSYDLSYASHQMVLDNASNLTKEIHKYACRLFDELWDGKTGIRLLALNTTRLKEGRDMRQLNLFDSTDYDKLEKLDRMVDVIRGKYGNDTIKRAAFIKSPDSHKKR